MGGWLGAYFLPEAGALITHGFSVIFFKFFDHWAALVVLGMILGPGIIGGKELLNKNTEWKKLLYIKGAKITIFGALPLLIGAWFLIVADLAKKEAQSIKDTKDRDIQWLVLKQNQCELKGRVIRYRDNKIGFLLLPSKEVAIIPERNLLHITSKKISKGERRNCPSI